VEQRQKCFSASEPLGTRGERHELSWRGLNPGDELFKQGGLAGTGLAGQTYGTNPAGSNSVEVLLQDSQFIVATQKWPLHRSQGGPRRHGRRAGELGLQECDCCRARRSSLRAVSIAIRPPVLNLVCVGMDGVLPRVRVPVHRQVFVLFPALNGAYGGLQVTGDPLPRVAPDTARVIHDTDVTVAGSEP